MSDWIGLAVCVAAVASVVAGVFAGWRMESAHVKRLTEEAARSSDPSSESMGS